MTALKVPFKGATTEQLKNKICSGSLPSFNLDYTKNLKLVIKSMLNSDEKKRPSAERILNFIYEK